MGKKKDMKPGGDTQHSPSTVFVTNLPFSFTNAQLEESFSEIGPIRRCFMVTKKGSTEHRGFGYVHFAVVADANRAIELRNGSTVGGRKIVVKQATNRAPLDQRRSKENQVQSGDAQPKNDKAVETTAAEKTETASHVQGRVQSEQASRPKNDKTVDIALSDKLVKALHNQGRGEMRDTEKGKAVSSGLAVEGNGYEKQRISKTVIVGGLLSDDMAEEVHRLAREMETDCSVTYPLSADVLDHHALAQDGCKMNMSSILFKSVKSARGCVAALHHKEIKGGSVWARQLGGEGSKTQKWKLIVRNLPFKAKVGEIREFFAAVGFVWDVFIPQNLETGLSKGFAFVKFTSKQDAENAIQKFNGKKIGKRPIAVDWAVPKKMYESGKSSVATDGDGEEKDDGSSSESEDHDVEPVKNAHGNASDDSYESDSIYLDKNKSEVDFEEEAEIARNVLKNIISSSSANISSAGDSEFPKENIDEKSVKVEKNSYDASVTHDAATMIGTRESKMDARPTQGEDELQRTVFISNLPFDVTNEEVKQRFSAFGEVQSFIPVLHRVTKRPRGTGFLKFAKRDGVEAALSAANSVTGLGILIKGRPVKFLKALDKKAAHDKALEKEKKEDHNHLNEKLAKEGFIAEGDPAAVGVSADDMSKRKKLHEAKMTKLRSPNFRVSRTRLIVYNVPKTMTEKELKKVFIDAVTSCAKKQKPSIRQIKILKDSKKEKGEKIHPRGVAFLEFTEHQHAIVALRILNNNPETFGPEHRPIVEFAFDNVQKLKLRTEKLQAQQQFHHNDRENMQQNNHASMERSTANRNSRKRKFSDGDASLKTFGNKNGVTDNLIEGTAIEDSSEMQAGSKRGKRNIISSEKKQKNPKLQLPKKQKGVEFDDMGPPPKRGSNANIVPKEENREADMPRKRRMLQDKSEQRKEGNDPKNRKRRKRIDPVGRDVTDKLDMLIEQYRSKFAGTDSNLTGDKKHASKNLKRWFES